MSKWMTPYSGHLLISDIDNPEKPQMFRRWKRKKEMNTAKSKTRGL